MKGQNRQSPFTCFRFCCVVLFCSFLADLGISPALAEIRIVDAFEGATACRDELGVDPQATSPEIEVREFDSMDAQTVPVVCPEGFQATQKTYETSGGTCEFLAAPGPAGKPHAHATQPSQLLFACRKQKPEDCASSGGKCRATARVTCTAIAMPGFARSNEACRPPGSYGQVSALTTGLSILSTLQQLFKILAELRDPTPVVTGTPSAPVPPAPQEATFVPTSSTFPGKKKNSSSAR